jgi:hypothetical protein
MGRYIVKLPDIGEGTTEAEIVSWIGPPPISIRSNSTAESVV